MVTRNFCTNVLIRFVPLLSMDSLSKALSLLPVIFILYYVTESMSVVYLTSTSCPWYTLLQHIRFQTSWLRHLSLVITFCFPSPFTSTPMTPPLFLNLLDFSTSSSYYHPISSVFYSTRLHSPHLQMFSHLFFPSLPTAVIIKHNVSHFPLLLSGSSWSWLREKKMHTQRCWL